MFPQKNRVLSRIFPQLQHLLPIQTFIVLFLFIGIVKAQPFVVQTPLLIETEILSTESNSLQSKKKYQAIIESGPKQQTFLTFYQASANKLPLCRLTSLADGSLTWQKTMRSKPLKVSEIIFLQPGFPIPVDILPVTLQEQAEITYETHTKTGGRTFLKSYTVVIAAINTETAEDNGWLKHPVPQGNRLRLFTVTDGQGRFISKQLWPVHGSWWFYEETPFRRSWRLE